ncbi:MAG: type II secretion system protein J [Gemmatimonadales bacterium]
MCLVTGTRHGFTLIEVMVALVLFGMVSLVIYQAMVTTQRVTEALDERGALQSGLRAGALVVPNELQQLTLGRSGVLDSVSDIRAVTDSSITYRAMRAFYTVCATPGSATSVIVVKAEPSGFASEYRIPNSSDSAFVFWEGDTLTAADDQWIPVGIAAAAAGTCAYPSSPATSLASYTLTLSGSGIPASFTLAHLYPGAPVRTYDNVVLSSYGSGGSTWLGMSINGAAIQPIMGPLTSTSGLALTYYDSTGAALTASAADIPKIRSIGLMLRAVTRAPIATSGRTRAVVSDSMMATITPRNAPRN